MTEKEDDYDPETHVTAGELRAQYGWDLGNIPDCAHIRRGAWRLNKLNVSYDEETRMTNFSGGVEFLEPFRWITGTYYVVKKDTLGTEE